MYGLKWVFVLLWQIAMKTSGGAAERIRVR